MLLDPLLLAARPARYAQVCAFSFGRALLFVAYLGLLFASVGTLAAYRRLQPVFHDCLEWAIQSFPTLVVTDGRITMPYKAPTTLKHPRIPEISITFDPERTAPVSMEEMHAGSVSFYVTPGKVYLTGKDEMRMVDLSRMPSMEESVTIDRDFFKKLSDTLPRVFYPILLVSAWLVFVVWKLLAGLLYSLVALAANAVFKHNLPYPVLYKTSLYAQTPSTLLVMVLLAFGRGHPLLPFISIFLTSLYITLALRAISHGAVLEPPEEPA